METEFNQAKLLVSKIILQQSILETEPEYGQQQIMRKYAAEIHQAVGGSTQLNTLPGLLKLAFLASKRSLSMTQREFLAQRVLLTCARDGDRKYYEMWQSAKLVR